MPCSKIRLVKSAERMHLRDVSKLLNQAGLVVPLKLMHRGPRRELGLQRLDLLKTLVESQGQGLQTTWFSILFRGILQLRRQLHDRD